MEPLPGGQGTSWRSRGLVLKPGAGPVTVWVAEALNGVDASEVRLVEHVAARDGRWVVEGWSATRWADGSNPDPASPSTWVTVVEAGRALHRAMAHVPRPGVLEDRTDAWAQADRAAWDEAAVALPPPLDDLAQRLREAGVPPGASQLVHGDLTANVLVARGSVPVVLDVSPYWRPPSYAEGVVLADALCWHAAPPELLEETGVPVVAVARALLFRVVTAALRADAAGSAVPRAEVQRYSAVVSALGL